MGVIKKWITFGPLSEAFWKGFTFWPKSFAFEIRSFFRKLRLLKRILFKSEAFSKSFTLGPKSDSFLNNSQLRKNRCNSSWRQNYLGFQIKSKIFGLFSLYPKKKTDIREAFTKKYSETWEKSKQGGLVMLTVLQWPMGLQPETLTRTLLLRITLFYIYPTIQIFDKKLQLRIPKLKGEGGTKR